MQTLHITRVSKKETDKNGKPYISKRDGKPYARASIQCKEYGDEWINGFWRDSLVVGATVEVEITEKEYNGKKYKNFEFPKKSVGMNDAKVTEILNGIAGIKLQLIEILSRLPKQTPLKEDSPFPDIAAEEAPDEIPF